MISIRDLHQRFGSHEVLRGISLEVSSGEIVAVMGSSGGGKTTLLRCIAGLLRPFQGEVLVDDQVVQQNPERARRKMGMVFQSGAPFDYLNVRDNVLFGVRRHRKASRQDEDRLVDEMLGTVGLKGSDGLMPNELSGGMRKRLGIARALALSPSVMLYDEPTTGLDPITTYTIDALIVRLKRDFGITSMIVSHDVASVFRTADRIAFLHEGELNFVGRPDAFQQSREPAIREMIEKAQATTL